MDRIDDCCYLTTTRHIGLVGDDDQREAGRLETGERFGDPREHFEIGRRGWRMRDSVTKGSPVQHAVAVEKHGGAERQLVDSHFVAAVLSRGCEISRCQTTA